METGPATQTRWLPSAYDPATQTKYFIQQDAVVLTESGMVALIAKADLGTPRKLPDGSMAVTGFLMQAFDCKARTTVILSADSYDAAGNLVGVYEPPEGKAAWRTIRVDVDRPSATARTRKGYYAGG